MWAPTGGKLTAGAKYTNTLRTPGTSAGLDVSAGTSGCGYATGDLTVYQLGTDSSGNVTSLEAGFGFHCDSATSPGIYGLIRYNATGPLPAGEPTGLPPTAPSGTTGPMTFLRGGQVVANGGSGTDGTALGPSSAAVPISGMQIPVGAAAWSPLANRVVYANSGALHAVRPDGSGDFAITAPNPSDNSADVQPTIASDGTVAFIRGGVYGGQIYLAALDGSSAGHEYQLNVLPNATLAYPAFAPDGSLLFEKVTQPTTFPFVQQTDVYRWSHGQATLLISNAEHPAPSPDGTSIAFVHPDAGGVKQVFTVGADGISNLTQVTHEESDASEPAWSPDGRTIAYEMPNWHEIVDIPSTGGAPVGSIPNADAPSWRPNPQTSHVTRIAGASRVETALAASQHDFADHGVADPARDQAGAVVLARSDSYADALGGSSLAVRKNAPLLITEPAALDAGVAREIQRVLAPNGTVYLLGGTSALSPAVQAAVQNLHYNVVRLSGLDRYATSVQIAKVVDPNPKALLIASGDNFPDALAAGATGLPLVLTSGSTMPKATAQYLNYIDPIVRQDGTSTWGTTQLITVGGPGDQALISGFQAGMMPRWGSQILRVKLVGATRQATALLVARAFFGGESEAAVATSTSWPDALSGGAMIGHLGGPLLLTDPSGLYGPVADLLHQEADTGGLLSVDVLGGPAALPPAIPGEIASQIGTPGHVTVNQAHSAPLSAGTRAAFPATAATRTH